MEQILDEPTNHLDVDAIQYLEDLLLDKQLTFLCVTHDRYFVSVGAAASSRSRALRGLTAFSARLQMDNVCQEILELESGSLRRYPGNYEKFLELKADRIAAEDHTRAADKNTLRRELEWVRKQPKARQAKSKEREARFYELKEKYDSSKRVDGKVSLQAGSQRIGTTIMNLKDAKLKFSDRTILDGFSYEFTKGDRVGIVGRNGAGKTTFLQVLAGAQSLDSGEFKSGELVRVGYYKQSGLGDVPPDLRVFDLVEAVCAGVPASALAGAAGGGGSLDPASAARRLLSRFQFPASRWMDPVHRLSGGERRRLQLLEVLAGAPNVLVGSLQFRSLRHWPLTFGQQKKLTCVRAFCVCVCVCVCVYLPCGSTQILDEPTNGK